MTRQPTSTRPILVEVTRSGDNLMGRPLRSSRRTVYPLVNAPDLAPPEEGDIILARRDHQNDQPVAYVASERLTRANEAKAAFYRIAAQFRLNVGYSNEVHAEAERWLSKPGLDDPELEDLSALPFVTIDNDDSRDLDQAMHIGHRMGAAGYTLSYALADASYYVRPGTALFDDALARGASFYLPGLSVPMLPRVLSEGLISLNAGQLRRALVFRMELDEGGHCISTRLLRARVRSVAKLSYNGVQRYYDEPETSALANQPYSETLDLLRTVGRLRRTLAQDNNVVEFNRTELHIKGTGRVFTAVADLRENVERYNEQVSLLCNVEGARMLNDARDEAHVQPIFRVHPSPPPEQLEHLESVVRGLVEFHNLDSADWLWRRNEPHAESLAAYLKRLPNTPQHGTLRRAIERQAMLVNVRSTFEDEVAPHFGIGAPFYARFSSPMREMVGIFTHKEGVEALLGAQYAHSTEDDLELRRQVIERGNRAKELQRRITKEANKLVIDSLFEDDLASPLDNRPLHPGVVLGMRASRVYVQLDNPPVEIKVYVPHLEQRFDVRYTLDDSCAVLRPQRQVTGAPTICLGDRVRVQTLHHDEKKSRWAFLLNRDSE